MDAPPAWRSVLVTALTVAALALVALAATTPRGPVVVMPPAWDASPASLSPEPVPTNTPPPLVFPEVAPDPRVTALLESLLPWLLVIVVVGVLLVVGYMAGRALARRRPPVFAPPPTGPVAGVEVAAVDAEVLAGTLSDSLDRLRAGMAVDDAVVACWRRLEEVAGASGAVREPTDTAEEYTVTVLRATPADPADLRRLADLYRAAMFGATPLTERDRASAIDALERLVAAVSPERVR